MTLWEVGKYREGWVKANTPPEKEKTKPDATYFSEEEFEAAMNQTFVETGETGTMEDFIGANEKARQ